MLRACKIRKLKLLQKKKNLLLYIWLWFIFMNFQWSRHRHRHCQTRPTAHRELFFPFLIHFWRGFFCRAGGWNNNKGLRTVRRGIWLNWVYFSWMLTAEWWTEFEWNSLWRVWMSTFYGDSADIQKTKWEQRRRCGVKNAVIRDDKMRYQ